MAARSNAIEEITRFWLQSRHECLVSESIPVPVPYALSDIDIVAVASDLRRKIELPHRARTHVGPRLIVETKDEHDWESSGNEFARLLCADLGKMDGKPYIPKGAKGVKFTMLREEHFAKATDYFKSEDFDRLFVVHALDWEVVGENASLLQQHRIHFVGIREVVADLFEWYRTDCTRRAGLRHELVGDIWHLLVGFCKCEPRVGLDGPSQEILEDVTAAVERFQSTLKVLRGKPEEVCAKAAYLCFFVRAAKLFRVIRQLVELGYGPEAELLLRPFFEIIADWLYVAEEPTQLGERYLMYETAAQLKRLRDTGKDEAAARHVEVKGDSVQKFCDAYSIKDGKLPKNWSGHSFEVKVKKAGLDNYYPISRYQSALIHNCPSRRDEFVTMSDEGIIQLITEPDFDGMKAIISLVCLALGPCLSILDGSFRLGLGSLLNRIGGKVRLYAGIPADV